VSAAQFRHITWPSAIGLKIGAPVISALGNVHGNFGFTTIFHFRPTARRGQTDGQTEHLRNSFILLITTGTVVNNGIYWRDIMVRAEMSVRIFQPAL